MKTIERMINIKTNFLKTNKGLIEYSPTEVIDVIKSWNNNQPIVTFNRLYGTRYLSGIYKVIE